MVFKNTNLIQKHKVSHSIGMAKHIFCLKLPSDCLNGSTTVLNKSEPELQIPQEAWLIGWLSGQKETGKFKMNLILMLIHFQLQEL